jgi:hypothetical protein
VDDSPRATHNVASPTPEFFVNPDAPLLASQLIVRSCLWLVAAIALFGGTLQMTLGQPTTTPRLDNVHRFMAGVYLGCGFICVWAGYTVRQQDALVFLIALTVLLAGIGRLISMRKVGVPEPRAVWLGYLTPELLVPWILVAAQLATRRAVGAP